MRRARSHSLVDFHNGLLESGTSSPSSSALRRHSSPVLARHGHSPALPDRPHLERAFTAQNKPLLRLSLTQSNSPAQLPVCKIAVSWKTTACSTLRAKYLCLLSSCVLQVPRVSSPDYACSSSQLCNPCALCSLQRRSLRSPVDLCDHYISPVSLSCLLLATCYLLTASGLQQDTTSRPCSVINVEILVSFACVDRVTGGSHREGRSFVGQDATCCQKKDGRETSACFPA